MPETAAGVVEDFRRFVAALGAGDAEDVHWAVQHDLVAQLPLTHVGRAERLGDTVALLHEHAGVRRPRRPRDGTPARCRCRPAPTTTRPPPSCGAATAPTWRAYGYDDAPPEAGSRADWERRAEAVLPLLRGTIDEHVRIGQLHALAQRRAERMHSAETQLQARAARWAGSGRSPTIANLEGHADFNVRWGWAEDLSRPGMTAIVRVKNEARALPWTLPPLLRAVDRVVLVDNGSTDGTPAVARETAAAVGAGALDVVAYPFAVARCGADHLATPETSVHSLAYFYNWSFAHVRTAYALKWDGDMVLAEPAVHALRDLAWQLEAADAVVRVPRLGFYVASDRLGYVDTAWRNCEAWAWPNRPGIRFVKALEWELPMLPPELEPLTLPEVSCLELKFLDGDEFGHWSPTDFGASPRTARKRREQEVFGALASGAAPPPGLVAVHAPEGEHVIDHVRRRVAAAAGSAAGGWASRVAGLGTAVPSTSPPPLRACWRPCSPICGCCGRTCCRPTLSSTCTGRGASATRSSSPTA